MKKLKYILSVIFILYTGTLIFLYFGLLYEKVIRPQFKNLDFEGFFLFGLVAMFLAFIDFLLVKWLIRSFKGRRAR
jgi:hypothetical protein